MSGKRHSQRSRHPLVRQPKIIERASQNAPEYKEEEESEEILVQRTMSWRVSVEDYFAQGMEAYQRELDAKAVENAENEQNEKNLHAMEVRRSIDRNPSYGLLGDMLNLQLKHLRMVTRATQTDWKWVTMAFRWHHGRLITASIQARPLKVTTIEHDYPTVIPREHTRATNSKGSKFADKAVDTVDLMFNPYDCNLRYTETKEQYEKYFSLRLTLHILRWRDRMRARMERQQKAALQPTTTDKVTLKPPDKPGEKASKYSKRLAALFKTSKLAISHTGLQKAVPHATPHGTSHHAMSHHGTPHHLASIHGTPHHLASHHGTPHHRPSHLSLHHGTSHHGTSHATQHHGTSHHATPHHGTSHATLHHGTSHHATPHHGTSHATLHPVASHVTSRRKSSSTVHSKKNEDGVAQVVNKPNLPTMTELQSITSDDTEESPSITPTTVTGEGKSTSSEDTSES